MPEPQVEVQARRGCHSGIMLVQYVCKSVNHLLGYLAVKLEDPHVCETGVDFNKFLPNMLHFFHLPWLYENIDIVSSCYFSLQGVSDVREYLSL